MPAPGNGCVTCGRPATGGIQVLQEYYVTVTRKLRPGLPKDAARADVQDLSAWCPAAIDVEDLEVAWSIEDRLGLSFWDSLIVAAAHVAGCEVILTEDLQHEMDLDGVRVRSLPNVRHRPSLTR